MSNVVFIDTETLGLDPDVHPVWEVGMIRPSGEEVSFQIRVTARDVSLAHPVALEISGFHERYDKTRAIMPREAALRLRDLIPEGAHLAGAVVSFDEERLRRLMWRYGYSPRWHYHLVEVETLAVGYIAGARSCGEYPPAPPPPWDSNEISRLVGVDPAQFDRHTALGGARWAKAIYDAVMES